MNHAIACVDGRIPFVHLYKRAARDFLVGWEQRYQKNAGYVEEFGLKDHFYIIKRHGIE